MNTTSHRRRPDPCHRPSAFRAWVILATALFHLLGGAAGARGAEDGTLPEAVEAGLTGVLALGSRDQGPEKTFDPAQVAAVVGYVRQAPDLANPAVQDRRGASGAFIAYSIDRSLLDVAHYAYSPEIPVGAVNPSSVNYGYWKNLESGGDFDGLWDRLDAGGAPVVVRGVLHESITPDLHTGAYYTYDLQRTLVFTRIDGQRTIISISDQIGDSETGKKGFIVGSDQDWNYVYSEKEGIDIMGLGWVRSKIYQFFSVLVYIENGSGPGTVKVGGFQWLDAGWADLNMVRSKHIRKGLERQAMQFKDLLESGRLPSPPYLEDLYAALERTDEGRLRSEVGKVARHLLDLAEEDPDLREKEVVPLLQDPAYVNTMNRHQLISVLVKEYIKLRLGRESPLDPSFYATL